MSEFEPIEPTEMALETPVDLPDVVEKVETAVSPPLVVMPDAPEEDSAPIGQHIMLFWIAGLVILLDQLTKMFVESRLPLYDMWAPVPSIQELFRITHVPNTGMAFGLFPSGSSFFLIVAVIVALAIIYYNFTLPKGQFALRLALGLQLGGALGNFIDRLRIGHVTDFLDFGPWPVFNVADMAIVSGAIVLGWLVLQETREEYAQKKREAAANATELSGTSDEFSTP